MLECGVMSAVSQKARPSHATPHEIVSAEYFYGLFQVIAMDTSLRYTFLVFVAACQSLLWGGCSQDQQPGAWVRLGVIKNMNMLDQFVSLL